MLHDTPLGPPLKAFCSFVKHASSQTMRHKAASQGSMTRLACHPGCAISVICLFDCRHVFLFAACKQRTLTALLPVTSCVLSGNKQHGLTSYDMHVMSFRSVGLASIITIAMQRL